MVRRPRLPVQYTPTHTVTGSLPTILSLGFNPYWEQSCDFSVPSAILLLLRRRGGGGGGGKLVHSRLFFLQTVITQNSKSSRFCNEFLLTGNEIAFWATNFKTMSKWQVPRLAGIWNGLFVSSKLGFKVARTYLFAGSVATFLSRTFWQKRFNRFLWFLTSYITNIWI